MKNNPQPRQMSESAFIDRFGGIYEHSPWVAQNAWQLGLDESHDTVAGLATLMHQVVESASRQQQLDLINAHPDLAGKAAQSGTLTTSSTREQAGAGIDQCTPEEFEQFQMFNQAYQAKFSFPFIMAVKGSDRHQILAAFAARLTNNNEQEFRQALNQIHKIAHFRLIAQAQT